MLRAPSRTKYHAPADPLGFGRVPCESRLHLYTIVYSSSDLHPAVCKTLRGRPQTRRGTAGRERVIPTHQNIGRGGVGEEPFKGSAPTGPTHPQVHTHARGNPPVKHDKYRHHVHSNWHKLKDDCHDFGFFRKICSQLAQNALTARIPRENARTGSEPEGRHSAGQPGSLQIADMRLPSAAPPQR